MNRATRVIQPFIQMAGLARRASAPNSQTLRTGLFERSPEANRRKSAILQRVKPPIGRPNPQDCPTKAPEYLFAYFVAIARCCGAMVGGTVQYGNRMHPPGVRSATPAVIYGGISAHGFCRRCRKLTKPLTKAIYGRSRLFVRLLLVGGRYQFYCAGRPR